MHAIALTMKREAEKKRKAKNKSSKKARKKLTDKYKK